MTPFSFFAATDVGKLRTNNEDNYIAEKLWGDRFLLLSAIDGVGGYAGGEVASALCKEVITDFLKNNDGVDLLSTVKQAVLEANNRIFESRKQDRQHPNMSCVASTALIDLEGRTAYLSHVGDSRIYLFESGLLRKVTHDHSLVGYREEIGELTEEQAMNHPQRNIIERSLGDKKRMYEDDNFIDASILSVPPDGKMLLCSDGLTDLVTSAEITEILQMDLDTEGKVKALINIALEKGGKDNVTVVLLEFSGKPGEVVFEKPEVTPEPPSSRPQLSLSKRWPGLLIGLLAGLLAGVAIGIFSGKTPKKEDQQPVMADSSMSLKRDSTKVMKDSLVSVNDSLVKALSGKEDED